MEFYDMWRLKQTITLKKVGTDCTDLYFVPLTL